MGDPDYAPAPSAVGSARLVRPRWRACRERSQDPGGNTSLAESKRDAPSPNKQDSPYANSQTEMGFCFSCERTGPSLFSSFEEAAQGLNEELFKQKLKQRVAGQISAKIFQLRMLKACITSDEEWFAQYEPDLSPAKQERLRENCENRRDELYASLEKLWPEMRVHLSLAQTPIRDEEIIRLPLKQAPSHLSGLFEDMPPLSPEEERGALSLYADRLLPVFSSRPLKNISHEELREEILQGRPLWEERGLERDEKFLTVQEHSHFREPVRKTLLELRRESREKYFEIMTNMPLLAHLKTGRPDKGELEQALSKMEGDLENFLEKVEKEDGNMGLLFSFEPLLEDLLNENPEFCVLAEKQKQEAEADENIHHAAFLGAVVLSAIPCFVSGPVGLPLCLAGGLATGWAGYGRARSSMDEALGRALTGKEFETIASLSEKERDAFIAKMLIPLAFWGTTAGTVRASLSLFSGKGASLTERAERILGRTLSDSQKQALRKIQSPRGESSQQELQAAGFSIREIQSLKEGGWESLSGRRGLSKGASSLSPVSVMSYGPILIKNFPSSQIRHFTGERGESGEGE